MAKVLQKAGLVCLIAVVSTYEVRYSSNDSLRYNASGDKCTALSGKCQIDSFKCAGSYVSNKCPGSKNIRCCTSKYHSSKCGIVNEGSALYHNKISVTYFLRIADTGFCSRFGFNIISRDSWGARRPSTVHRITTPVNDFFIHHTDTLPCRSTSVCIQRMKAIQNFHMDYRKWGDIGYSFLVGEDGNVYEGRGWDREGAHTYNYNKISLAASLIGNFRNRIPNSAALRAVKGLMKCGANKRKLTSTYSIFGHRDVWDTDCPGDALYNNLKMWPNFHKHKPNF